MLWTSRNCDRCVKSSHLKENPYGEEEYTKFRCAINRDIILACVGDGTTGKRTYNICQKRDCPFRLEKRKRYQKRDIGPTLFDNEEEN